MYPIKDLGINKKFILNGSEMCANIVSLKIHTLNLLL